MLDNHLAMLALRNVLLTTQVTTTGSVTLEATANGYQRATGDFVADGFVVGQEVLPSGFAENPAGVIKSLTATVMTLHQSRTAEASGAGRTIDVPIPSLRAWENRKVDTDQNLWHIAEEFIPGPIQMHTAGPLGWIDQHPIYVVKVRGRSGTGAAALYKMADAILDSFPPRTALTLADSTVLRVRSTTGPTRGQIVQDEDGFAVIVITIPLWARTQNTI